MFTVDLERHQTIIGWF